MPYFDHSATTPIDSRVLDLISQINGEYYGNPSSIHRYGQKARALVETARRQVAQLINCNPGEIIFTGSGSEANNLVLWNQLNNDRPHVIASAIEHPAVLQPLQRLSKLGIPSTIIKPDRTGRIDPAAIISAIRPDTGLVSVMLANNEVGTIEPVKEISTCLAGQNILLHTDAVQAAGKIPLDTTALGVDFLTLSAHKFYGPKGVGALFRKQGVPLKPLITGGGQEQNLRSGTENVAGIAGMGLAAKLAKENLENANRHLSDLESYFIESIKSTIPEARINGNADFHIPGLVNLTIPGITNDILTVSLDMAGMAISNGSACSSGTVAASPVLKALGFSDSENRSTIRISFGLANTIKEVDQLVTELVKVVSR